MNILGKLFGTKEIIDAAISTGDKLFHTSEEKADHYLNVMKMYEAFKIAQRLLACIFGIPYALAWFITFIATFFRDDVSAQTALLSGTMGQIVTVIVGFYFLGGAINSIGKSNGSKEKST